MLKTRKLSENIKKVCPNCNTEFDSSCSFCPNCGQVNRKLDLSFKYFISEFLSINFNIDSKIYRTLKLLMFSPAKLSMEFIAGKRVKYIPPMRLYMVISLIFFFVLSLSYNEEDYKNVITNENESTTIDTTSVYLGTSNNITYSIDDIIGNDSVSVVEQTLMNKLGRLQTKHGIESFMQLFQRYISVGMFFLIPITALLLFLLFYKGTYYMQHLIFLIHLQSLLYLLFTIFNLIDFAFQSDVFLLIKMILFFAIVFLWFKAFYKIGVGRTIWKMFVFFIVYALLLSFFFILVLGFSIYNM